MFRGILALTLSLGLGAAAAPAALAQAAPAITEQEAHAIAVDAYIYFYPILTMDLSRKQFTNSTTDFKEPMNTFVNVPEYPPANFKGVVRSNFDTLYSVSWLDMTKEPVVISEDDYNAGYTRKHHNEVVFVLPNHDGTCPPGQNLLDTAKLLMAATPNGI